MSQVIPDAAVEAAATAWTRLMCGCYDPEDVPHLHDELRKILEAAAPHMLAEVWQSAYNQGVDDERTSQANAGIAGCFCHSFPCQCFIAPARANPYRSQE